MNADPDRIPADDDPNAAARALREARAQLVVVMSPNIVMPLADAEVYAHGCAGAGVSTHVVGWRKARGPHELAPHYQAAWSGDTSELEGFGRPWCWGQRTAGGTGSHQALLDDQWAGSDLAQAAAEARPVS